MAVRHPTDISANDGKKQVHDQGSSLPPSWTMVSLNMGYLEI